MLTSLPIALLGNPALMATDVAASPSIWEARPLALEMHAGFGTPVGLFSDFGLPLRPALGTAILINAGDLECRATH